MEITRNSEHSDGDDRVHWTRQHKWICSMLTSLRRALGPLRHIQGRVPHPLGDIAVALERDGPTGLRATVALPAGLSGVLVWYGRRVRLHAGRQDIRF